MKLKISLLLGAALTCHFNAVATPAAIKDRAEKFSYLVESNASLPAVQVYKAELAKSAGKFEDASKHYISAVNLGLSSAVWNLMEMIDSGHLSGQSLSDSLFEIKSKASEDIDLSLFLLNFYHDKDEYATEAFHWANNSLRIKAKGAGEILAGYVLGGVGGAEKHYSVIEAATMLKNATSEGSATAALTLAKMFSEGSLVNVNYGQARHYYEIAAKASLVDAYYPVAYYNEFGIGGDKDLVAAVEWYQRLLNTDQSALANFRLSQIYMYNKDKFKDSKVEGVAHLMRSAELGNADALYKVGISKYYGSEGFKVEVENAISYLSRSAEMGNKLAAGRLVQIYKNGERGVKPNPELAKKYQKVITNAPKAE